MYVKKNVKFTHFQAVKSLWLIVIGYKSPTFPHGLTAAIVPNQPMYLVHTNI